MVVPMSPAARASSSSDWNFGPGRNSSGWYFARAGLRAIPRVSLSDCAAMAVRPIGALCAVALSDQLSMEDAVELHRGVVECGAKYSCPLVGGDTNSWPQPTAITGEI